MFQNFYNHGGFEKLGKKAIVCLWKSVGQKFKNIMFISLIYE